MIGYGGITGWVSPALAILASDSTPLTSGPLTNEQVSWIGSINSFGAMFGALSFGLIVSLIGCKRALLLLSLPILIFWFFVYFGTTYIHIFFARLIGGLAAGGVQSTLVLYVSEIANDE